MKNVVLVRGKCSICGGSIDVEWAGENPSLGTKCRNCSFQDPEPQLFTPEHIEIHAEAHVDFNPLFGRWDTHFDWKGTRVMVNDEVGIVNST